MWVNNFKISIFSKDPIIKYINILIKPNTPPIIKMPDQTFKTTSVNFAFDNIPITMIKLSPNRITVIQFQPVNMS